MQKKHVIWHVCVVSVCVLMIRKAGLQRRNQEQGQQHNILNHQSITTYRTQNKQLIMMKKLCATLI